LKVCGVSLAPNGQPGDTMTCTLTIPVTGSGGQCINSVQNPDDPFNVATVIVNVTPGATLKVTKTALTPHPQPGGPAKFQIEVENRLAVAQNNLIVTDAAQSNPHCMGLTTVTNNCANDIKLSCTGGGTPNCTDNFGGFTLSPVSLGPAPDKMTCTFEFMTDATAVGQCKNDVNVGTGGSEGLVATASVTMTPGSVQVTKEVISPVPPLGVKPGSPATFRIHVKNTSQADITGLTLTDVVPKGTAPDLCFDDFDPATACGTKIVCTTGGANCGLCAVRIPPNGFDITNITLGPMGSATEEVVWDATVTATTPNPNKHSCNNSASSTSPGATSNTVTIEIDPDAGGQCQVYKDIATFPKSAVPWVYTLTCPLTPAVPNLPGNALKVNSAVGDAVIENSVAGNELALYQFSCDCTATSFKMYKSVLNEVHLVY